jgi:uncharacterized NAD(P)/FAD-binding protein YdhS
MGPLHFVQKLTIFVPAIDPRHDQITWRGQISPRRTMITATGICMKKIVIIGGGLSGTLLTINLLKLASGKEPMEICLIDRNPDDHVGAAYSCNDECLLLNVPACRMGAFSSDQAHFLKWAKQKGISAGEWDFLPRKYYKNYILETLQRAVHEKKDNVSFNRIKDNVSGMSINGGHAMVILENQAFQADHVVLALGNFPPRNPSTLNFNLFESKYFIQNPGHKTFFVRCRKVGRCS